MTIAETSAAPQDQARPAAAAMIWRQVRHSNRGFWRTPIAAFFTLAFPLIFLLLLGSLTGNETIPGSRVRLAQFLTPAVAAFAAVTASFTSLAIGLVLDRERGILKRLRGAPLSPASLMAARMGSMLWISTLATLLMVAVGVLFFDVQIVVDKLPAAVITLIVGILSFAGLGVAVAALVPSNEAASAVTNSFVIPLAFVSDVFVVGAEMPRWLEMLGWLFPLKHFAHGLRETFDPFTAGLGFGWDHLAVMVAWGVVGAAVAIKWFRWEPRPAGRSRRTAVEVAPATTRGLRPASDAGRPSLAALVIGQARAGFAAFLRSRSSAFFVLVFPSLLLAIFSFVFGNPNLPNRGGITLTQFAAPVLAVFGVATAAYADFSERLAFARDRGVLKRLRGTPVPAGAFIAGRILATVVIALVSLTITMAVGIAFFDAQIVPRMLAGVLLSTFLGIGTFATLGLALAGAVRDAESVPAVANATLLPLAFFSDIFLIGDPPGWMATIGNLFPLKHFANAIADGFNSTVGGAGFFADHLAVMGLWLLVATFVALRLFSWQPRAADRPGRQRTRRDRAATTAG